jgi:hypothetical protein
MLSPFSLDSPSLAVVIFLEISSSLLDKISNDSGPFDSMKDVSLAFDMPPSGTEVSMVVDFVRATVFGRMMAFLAFLLMAFLAFSYACKVIQTPRSHHTSFQKKLHISLEYSFSLFLTNSHTPRNQAIKHHQIYNHSNSQGAGIWVGPSEHICIATHFLLISKTNNLISIEVLDIHKEAFNVINIVARATSNIPSATK